LPKIVIDELVNKFREEIQRLFDSIRKCEADFRNMTGRYSGIGKINVSKEVIIYRDWLQNELIKNKIESIDYPNISHESLVRRALERRKPFSSKGQNGYRDSVLWETILQWKKLHRGEVLLVSKNTFDFADPGNAHRLHPHLIDDLRSLSHSKASIQFFAGFEDLLARALYPRERLFPELETQVKNGRLGQHELRPWLTSILPGITVKSPREQLRYRDRLVAKDWVIGDVHSINQLSLNSTSRLTERTILIILFFTFSADISPKQSELLLDDVSGTERARFISFLSVEFDHEANTIVGFEFDHIVGLNE
jgi:PIN domain